MQQSRKLEAADQDGSKKNRANYVSPAIVYVGKLTIRAGSPIGNEPFGGPPSPFSPPGS